AASLPPGFTASILVADLTYPSCAELDDRGGLYVAEAGYSYRDEAAPARIRYLVRDPGGQLTASVVADQLNGPINGLLWHQGRLYVSHRGKVSVLEGPGKVAALVTGLPPLRDHHNTRLA